MKQTLVMLASGLQCLTGAIPPRTVVEVESAWICRCKRPVFVVKNKGVCHRDPACEAWRVLEAQREFPSPDTGAVIDAYIASLQQVDVHSAVFGGGHG
jgi:hypothetical protein